MNWLIGIYSFSAASQFMHHLWSLAIEEQFHLFWPPVVRRFTRNQLLGFCLFMAVPSLSSRILLHSSGNPVAAYMYTLCRLDGFAVGASIALAIRDPLDSIFLKRWCWPSISMPPNTRENREMPSVPIQKYCLYIIHQPIIILASNTKLREVVETSFGKNGALLVTYPFKLAFI